MTSNTRSHLPVCLALASIVAMPATLSAQDVSDTLVAIPATHSHNDYYRKRPLEDALEAGMISIEADIFGVDLPFIDDEGNSGALRELYIAHDWEEIEGNVPGYARSKGTLSTLYLDPLWERYLRDGYIYPDATLLLHADMKTATERTWSVLENTLRNYPGLFTSFDLETGETVEGPVTVYTNDEPDAESLAAFGTIHSTADGRFGDIFNQAIWESPDYRENAWRMPIVSSNLRAYMDGSRMFDTSLEPDEIAERYGADFPVLGSEEFGDALAADDWALATRLLDDGVSTVSDYLVEHLAEADRLGAEHGHLMRFWASPDAPWFWELVAPLDHVVLLTDSPAEASEFLTSH